VKCYTHIGAQKQSACEPTTTALDDRVMMHAIWKVLAANEMTSFGSHAFFFTTRGEHFKAKLYVDDWSLFTCGSELLCIIWYSN
jgi:hypothetical protein